MIGWCGWPSQHLQTWPSRVHPPDVDRSLQTNLKIAGAHWKQVPSGKRERQDLSVTGGLRFKWVMEAF